MNKIKTLIGMILVFSMCSCTQKLPDRKLDNVVRILMHETTHYTLFTQEKGVPEVTSESFRLSNAANIRIIADVPSDQPMWANVKSVFVEPFNDTTIVELIIHIHQATDINGAGWNHGKHGAGQTTVIE